MVEIITCLLLYIIEDGWIEELQYNIIMEALRIMCDKDYGVHHGLNTAPFKGLVLFLDRKWRVLITPSGGALLLAV